jgi:hypothetical protein
VGFDIGARLDLRRLVNVLYRVKLSLAAGLKT